MDSVSESPMQVLTNSVVRHELNFSHVKLSPYALEVERATMTWLEASGLIPDECYAEKVRRMAVWAYAGFSHPFASFEELVLYSKYITLWLLWDDVVVEKSTDLGAIMHGITNVFRWDGRAALETDPYLRAWKSIVDGYKALGASSDYGHRLSRKMNTWVKTVAHENSSIHATSRVSPWAHLRRRLVTIGVIPTAQLLDLQIGNLDRIPAARRVVMTASAIVAIVNELVSVEKDADRVNLVVLVQNHYQCSFDSAYGQVVDLCRTELAKLVTLIDALPSELQAWGVLMHHMAEGFSYWHFVCPRYDGARIVCRVLHALPKAAAPALDEAIPVAIT